MKIALTAIAATLLLAAAPASAKVANFSASLEGTYTQQGTETNTRCWRAEENGDTTYFTGTRTASENDTFKSVKPVKLTVSRLRGQRNFDAGSLKHLRTVFTVNRTASRPDCTPSDRFNSDPPDCGTKNLTFPLRVYGRQDHTGFSYLFTKNFSTYYPDDPFNNCPLVGGSWPGQLRQSGTGKVRVSKLFGRTRKIVVHGGDSDSKHESSGELTTDSSYKLSWTLTLRRR